MKEERVLEFAPFACEESEHTPTFNYWIKIWPVKDWFHKKMKTNIQSEGGKNQILINRMFKRSKLLKSFVLIYGRFEEEGWRF